MVDTSLVAKKNHPGTGAGRYPQRLLAAGKIPDPYYGKNELDLQWIGQRDWVFIRILKLLPSLAVGRWS